MIFYTTRIVFNIINFHEILFTVYMVIFAPCCFRHSTLAEVSPHLLSQCNSPSLKFASDNEGVRGEKQRGQKFSLSQYFNQMVNV